MTTGAKSLAVTGWKRRMNKGIAIHLLVPELCHRQSEETVDNRDVQMEKSCSCEKKKKEKKVLLEGWTAAQTQRKKACLSLYPGGADG